MIAQGGGSGAAALDAFVRLATSVGLFFGQAEPLTWVLIAGGALLLWYLLIRR